MCERERESDKQTESVRWRKADEQKRKKVTSRVGKRERRKGEICLHFDVNAITKFVK